MPWCVIKDSPSTLVQSAKIRTTTDDGLINNTLILSVHSLLNNGNKNTAANAVYSGWNADYAFAVTYDNVAAFGGGGVSIYSYPTVNDIHLHHYTPINDKKYHRYNFQIT